MKVLRIWHAAVVAEYRKKIRALAALPEVEMTLLVPPSWKEGGARVAYLPNPVIDAGYQTIIGRIRGENNVRRYLFLSGLFRAMARLRPDILDIEEEPFAFVTTQALWYRNLLRLPSRVIFHTAHNILRPMEFPFERLQKQALAASDAAIVRNRAAENYLRDRGFAGQIFLSGNGIDLSHFSPGPSGALHERLSLAGKKVIGFVGKLKPGKGVFTLLEAFSFLPNNPVLLLVGDGPMKEELLAQARQRGLAERVRLVGSVAHEETPLYYRLMNVCVLPSETEGGWRESFGRALVEAMACGVPVIGSSSGAIPDTIGSAGRIFPEGDAQALAKVIREVLENPRALNSLRAAGLARARDFTWEAIAAINYQAYQHVLRLPRSASLVSKH